MFELFAASDQRAHEGVLEADRPGVVTHRAQPEGPLAERLAAAQRLDGGRVDQEDDHHGADDERRHRTKIGLGIVIGGIVISLFLPLIKLLEGLSK